MSLSRETRDQLWRALLMKGAAPRDPRPPLRWIIPATVLLTVLALYLFTKL